MPAIEIFRAGRHTAMNGKTIDFSVDDLKATAAAYAPAQHEAPAVVGHPASDAPAYGWAKSLVVMGDRLLANLDQVDPAFAEMVKAGRFKKVSASFYEPTAEANPTPGVYALRHIGFLGAQPPAVKGLKPVAFADRDGGYLAFGDIGSSSAAPGSDNVVARLFRGLREYVIGRDGPDAADRVLPSGDIDYLAADAAQPDTTTDEDDDMTSQPGFAEREADLRKREEKVTAEEKRLKDQQLAFAEEDKAARKRDDEEFLGKLVERGSVLPVHKALLLGFLERLHGGETIAFGEGDAKRDMTPRLALRQFLLTLPKQVEFAERGKGKDPVRARGVSAPQGALIDADRAELHGKALAYMETHKGVDYVTAVRAVENQA